MYYQLYFLMLIIIITSFILFLILRAWLNICLYSAVVFLLFVLPFLNPESSYGGEVVPEYRTAEATHIITTDKVS